jgi:hypothetical protein
MRNLLGTELSMIVVTVPDLRGIVPQTRDGAPHELGNSWEEMQVDACATGAPHVRENCWEEMQARRLRYGRGNSSGKLPDEEIDPLRAEENVL